MYFCLELLETFVFALVPDKATFVKMLEREQELQQSKPAQQATSLAYIDKRTMSKNVSLQIQLRVVREFGLPDSAVEVLQNRQYYYTNNSHSCRHHHHRCQQAQHLQQHYQIRSRSSASNIPQSLSYDNFEVCLRFVIVFNHYWEVLKLTYCQDLAFRGKHMLISIFFPVDRHCFIITIFSYKCKLLLFYSPSPAIGVWAVNNNNSHSPLSWTILSILFQV